MNQQPLFDLPDKEPTRCLLCNRELRDPASISRQIGGTCLRKVIAKIKGERRFKKALKGMLNG